MDFSDHSEASHDNGDGMPTSRPSTSSNSRPRLFSNAPSSSFFTRGKKNPPPQDNDNLNTTHNLSSSEAVLRHDSIIGARMKAAIKIIRKDGKASSASELKSNRRRSRKRRNSDPENAEIQLADGNRRHPPGYMHLRAAHVISTQTNESLEHYKSLPTKLLEMTMKENVCDIEMVGTDGIAVKAPSFLLASHSKVFEEMFYPKDESKETIFFRFMTCRSEQPKKVEVEFASASTIKAAVHFFASLELPPVMENEPSEANIRTLSQLHLFAQLFKIPSLSNAAYRAARRLMNKKSSLVCAAFDECNVLLTKAWSKDYWGLTMEKQYDDLCAYALDYLRESLPDAGVIYFCPASIEALICDSKMDEDEFNIWRILNLWVNSAPGNDDDKIATARSLMSHIQLEYIDPIQLNLQIKRCAYVDPRDIEEALKQIALMLENESPDDKERVIVEGAGDDINGVYVLVDDAIGLESSEVMFLKEGDDNGDICSDYGLYPYGKSWSISNCMEYFNILYTCEVSQRKGHSLRRPPKWGWKCVGGTDPAPTCTWKPSKKEENSDDPKAGIAPPLLENEKAQGSGVLKSSKATDVRSSCGYAIRASLTLSEMMSLPEDADFENSDHQYPSTEKDLDAMMHLSVDEGHDDEVAGYDVNYSSATEFVDNNTGETFRRSQLRDGTDGFS